MVLAILAIAVSILTLIVTIINDIKLNSVNLKSHYYEAIFNDYLIKKIPKARQYLRYENSRLTDIDELYDVLSDLKKDSLYFKYTAKTFYTKLVKSIDALEQFVNDCSNISESDIDAQSLNILKVGDGITSLYKVINDSLVGK